MRETQRTPASEPLRSVQTLNFDVGTGRKPFGLTTGYPPMRGSPRLWLRVSPRASCAALDGGGLANFSVNVATVAANAAIGVYY